MVYQRALVFGNYQKVLCFYGLPTGLNVYTHCIEFEPVYLQMCMFVLHVIQAIVADYFSKPYIVAALMLNEAIVAACLFVCTFC